MIDFKISGFNRFSSGKAYLLKEQDFVCVRRLVKRESRKFLLGSGKLLHVYSKRELTFQFTAITILQLGSDRKLSGGRRSLTKHIFDCTIQEEIQQLLDSICDFGILFGHAKRVQICITLYPNICIFLAHCEQHFFCQISSFVFADSVHVVSRGSMRQWSKLKYKRSKACINYYSNCVATFHLLIMSGDIESYPRPSTITRLNDSSTCVPLSSPYTRNGHKNRSIINPSRCQANLINVPCLPHLLNDRFRNSMLLCIFNARSVRNRTADIRDYVCDSKADLYTITETWLNTDDAAVRAELFPEGFQLIDHPRVNRSGGGIALLYRDSLQLIVVAAGEKDSFEFAEWTETSSCSNTIRVVNIYRPAYSAEHRITTPVFFMEFANYMETLLLCKEKLLITGDFNIHVDVSDQSDVRTFLDLLESLSLVEHVTKPTHVDGHILDLIITRSSDNIILDPPYIDRFISDHVSVLCNLCEFKPPIIAKKISYRKIKSVNLDSLRVIYPDLHYAAIHLLTKGLIFTISYGARIIHFQKRLTSMHH